MDDDLIFHKWMKRNKISLKKFCENKCEKRENCKPNEGSYNDCMSEVKKWVGGHIEYQ